VVNDRKRAVELAEAPKPGGGSIVR